MKDREAVQTSSNKFMFDIEKEDEVPRPELKQKKRICSACQIAVNGAEEMISHGTTADVCLQITFGSAHSNTGTGYGPHGTLFSWWNLPGYLTHNLDRDGDTDRN